MAANQPQTTDERFTTIDGAARAISDELKGTATLAVDTDPYGIVRVGDVAADHDEGTVDLHVTDGPNRSVYPGEICGIEVRRAFRVGDRVEMAYGTVGTITSINEQVGGTTDRACVKDDTGSEASVGVGSLTLVDGAYVECAGDGCRKRATKEVSGCRLGLLNYTLRVCPRCARKASQVRTEDL